jgi:hypothetical protein
MIDPIRWSSGFSLGRLTVAVVDDYSHTVAIFWSSGVSLGRFAVVVFGDYSHTVAI